jgi:hypothetical protein
MNRGFRLVPLRLQKIDPNGGCWELESERKSLEGLGKDGWPGRNRTLPAFSEPRCTESILSGVV